MRASFSVNVGGLEKLAAKLQSPDLQAQISNVVHEKAIAAIIGQGIAENFDKEGPGWQPIRQQTIRMSLAKAHRANLVKGKYNTVRKKVGGEMQNVTIVKKNGEEKTVRRRVGAQMVEMKARKILQKTRLLYKSVTTPGYDKNIYKVDGNHIIWGTDLVYAAIHNKGGIIKHPGTNKGFGIQGFKIRPHNIPIPKREFLFLTDHWKGQIYEFMLRKYKAILKNAMKTRTV